MNITLHLFEDLWQWLRVKKSMPWFYWRVGFCCICSPLLAIVFLYALLIDGVTYLLEDMGDK
jgi:hypothetical protein